MESINKNTELPAQNVPTLGKSQIFDFSLTADLSSLLLALSGSVTLSTGASALVTDGIANLIESVELKGDGSKTIASMSGAQFFNGNFFRRKKGHKSTAVQPGLTAAAHPFSIEGFLDMAAFAALRPKDSNLRETSYKTLQLVIKYASDFTGVFTGGGFAVSASTINMVVSADETIEVKDAKGFATSPIFRPLISGRDESFSGATDKQRFKLTPEQLLRGIGLRVLNGSSALSDAILTSVRVYVGKDQRTEITAAQLKKNNNNINMAPGTGYYFLDFADGKGSPDRLNDAYDLRNDKTMGADSVIEFTTAAAGQINVVQYGFEPL